MAFATGRHMTGADAAATRSPPGTSPTMVMAVHAERVEFHDGDAELAPGLSVHHIGGHTDGLQVVRVATATGWLVLASDATPLLREHGATAPVPDRVRRRHDGRRVRRASSSSPAGPTCTSPATTPRCSNATTRSATTWKASPPGWLDMRAARAPCKNAPPWVEGLFGGLDDDARRAVWAHMRRRRFARGEVIFHEGDPGDALHHIVKGHVSVRVSTPRGDQAILRVLGPDDVVGEFAVVSPGPTCRNRHGPRADRDDDARPRIVRRTPQAAAERRRLPHQCLDRRGSASLGGAARGALPAGGQAGPAARARARRAVSQW